MIILAYYIHLRLVRKQQHPVGFSQQFRADLCTDLKHPHAHRKGFGRENNRGKEGGEKRAKLHFISHEKASGKATSKCPPSITGPDCLLKERWNSAFPTEISLTESPRQNPLPCLNSLCGLAQISPTPLSTKLIAQHWTTECVD
jgi:hypothetical protein